MIVAWRQQWSSTLEHSGLIVKEYNGRLLLESELRMGMMLLSKPTPICETRYEPELSRSREYGWKRSGRSTEFITSTSLGELYVIQLMDLIERNNSGKIKRPEW
jgi:hypothetical protein